MDVLGLGAFLPENKPGENSDIVDNLNLLKAITEKEKNEKRKTICKNFPKW